ncbi:nitrate- and nitrite sensing domain-containing protein [Methylomonas koyamae]|uniref:nitrate- and nitrite sensing domain-containing protein n=1 Tax=Methylomonas koyamae TaxID=702114 RepID=UPI0028734873|nr:nitrate- and nitrite sensing domain-containing protein [Methylomonas koyamae]WNB76268.1 nitrate- and nitrite sensing domain-containing protein [Methylomonas koyamae]
MTDTLILLCAAAGSAGSVLAALWHCRNRTRLAHLAGQQTSIAINRELKQLLGKIQQHRGMASGYLNGDASFKYKISALQAEIGRETEQIAKRLHALPAHRGGFEAIESRWRSLSPTVLQGTREQSFDHHCQLIAAVLDLMRDIAERSQLHRDSACPFGFVEIVWHLLPDTAEAIGQTRAIGTGIAAAGRSLSTERIKLGYLLTRIRNAAERLESGIVRTPSAMAGAEFRHSFGEVRQRIDSLVGDIEQQLLASERPAIDPAGFFEHATQTLNGVFDLYDRAEAAANRELQTRLAGAARLGRQSLATLLFGVTTAAAGILPLAL